MRPTTSVRAAEPRRVAVATAPIWNPSNPRVVRWRGRSTLTKPSPNARTARALRRTPASAVASVGSSGQSRRASHLGRAVFRTTPCSGKSIHKHAARGFDQDGRDGVHTGALRSHLRSVRSERNDLIRHVAGQRRVEVREAAYLDSIDGSDGL